MAMNRRSFFSRSWKFVAAVLSAEALWTTWDLINPRVSEGFGSKISAGPVSGFAPGEVRYFASGRFYVVNHEEEFKALYQKCPHLGCRVPFCESSGQFECPCHGSAFNVKGEVLGGPSPRGMDSFAIEIGEEGIVVDTGTLIKGPAKGVITLQDGEAGPSCLRDGDEASGDVNR